MRYWIITSFCLLHIFLPRVTAAEEGNAYPITRPPELLYPWIQIAYSGGDGTSISNAVVITGTTSSLAGVGAEKRWIEKKYGYWTRIMEQALMESGGRQYDVIKINKPITNPASLYFDITDFFGKTKIGAWKFTPQAGGPPIEGEIGDWDLPDEEQGPWETSIENMGGELVYQFGLNAHGNGKLAICPIVNGQFHGEWRSWWLDSSGERHTRYVNGTKQGLDVIWATNGVKKLERQWHNGKQHGSVKAWDEQGRLFMLETFKNGNPDGAHYYSKDPGTGEWKVTHYENGEITKEAQPSVAPYDTPRRVAGDP